MLDGDGAFPAPAVQALRAQTLAQFPAAVDATVRLTELTAFFPNATLAVVLTFAHEAAAAAARLKVLSTPPTAMSREWYANQTLVLAVSLAASHVELAPAPSPPPSPPAAPPFPPAHPSPSPPPDLVAAMEAEVDAVSTGFAGALVVSLGVSVSASVLGGAAAAAAATAAGAAAGAAAASGSAGGIASAGGVGSGGGGSGGGMLPLIFGAQRFASSSGLGVPPSEVQRGVADSMAWMEGDFSLISPPGVPRSSTARRRRRHLADSEVGSGDAGSADTSDDEGGRVAPRELTKLFNLLLTMLFALTLTVLIQWTLVLLWRHVVNRRYYAHLRQLEEDRYFYGDRADEADARRHSDRLCLCCGPHRKAARKAPKFFPFPKSLIWPTPLFFTCCVFVTGLTRAAVRLLAASPAHCGAICPASAIVTLVLLVMLVGGAIYDLIRLHRALVPSVIRWKPAAKQPTPSGVTDPYLRWRAKAKVSLMSAKVLIIERASFAATHRRSSRSSRVVPIDASPTPARMRVASPEVRVFRDPTAEPPPSPPSEQPPPAGEMAAALAAARLAVRWKAKAGVRPTRAAPTLSPDLRRQATRQLRLVKEEDRRAAVMLQAASRGHAVRRRVRTEREAAASALQEARSAVAIQTAQRSRQARARVAARRAEADAARAAMNAAMVAAGMAMRWKAKAAARPSRPAPTLSPELRRQASSALRLVPSISREASVLDPLPSPRHEGRVCLKPPPLKSAPQPLLRRAITASRLTASMSSPSKIEPVLSSQSAPNLRRCPRVTPNPHRPIATARRPRRSSPASVTTMGSRGRWGRAARKARPRARPAARRAARAASA